jgi:TetR/AcrR family transcriptional regulator, regulator of biofilm formation and stress response
MVEGRRDPAVSRIAKPVNWYICTSMVTSTPNHARPRGAARREALLDAVLRIVAESGVDAVTHRRVAEVAGLPLASTTYWFQSKEHLLTAALERAADADIERLHGFLGEAPEPAADPLGLAVGAVLGPNEDAAKAPPSGAAAQNASPASRGWLLATYALLLEAARRPALRGVTERWTDAYLEALPPLLAAAGSRHPRADAGLLLAAADGLLVDQLVSGDASDLGPQLRRLAEALVRA